MKKEVQHGAIFKSDTEGITAILYQTTSVLHIQGMSSLKWCKQFSMEVQNLRDIDKNLTNCKVVQTQPLHSTPKQPETYFRVSMCNH